MCFEATFRRGIPKILQKKPSANKTQQTSTWDHQHPTAWLFAVSKKKHQKVQRKAHLGLLRRQLRCLPLGAADLLGRGGGGHLAGSSQLRQRRGFGGTPKRPSRGGCRFFGVVVWNTHQQTKNEGGMSKNKKGDDHEAKEVVIKEKLRKVKEVKNGQNMVMWFSSYCNGFEFWLQFGTGGGWYSQGQWWRQCRGLWQIFEDQLPYSRYLELLSCFNV